MIDRVTQTEFVDAFVKIDREDNFSYWGRVALFEYFEEWEEDMGEQIKFDPIAICCKFTEYESLDELNKAYDKEFKDLDEVSHYSQVIPVRKLNSKTWEYEDGGFIVRDW